MVVKYNFENGKLTDVSGQPLRGAFVSLDDFKQVASHNVILDSHLQKCRGALDYVFGRSNPFDWDRIVKKKLTPPWPLAEHLENMGLVHASKLRESDTRERILKSEVDQLKREVTALSGALQDARQKRAEQQELPLYGPALRNMRSQFHRTRLTKLVSYEPELIASVLDEVDLLVETYVRLRKERDSNHEIAIANGQRAKEEHKRAEKAEAEIEWLTKERDAAKIARRANASAAIKPKDEAIEDLEYICGRWEKNQGASTLTVAVRQLLASLASSRVKVPEGQTALDDNLRHPLLDVIEEGKRARDSGQPSPYSGHSLEHCLHAEGWVRRDLELALREERAKAKASSEQKPGHQSHTKSASAPVDEQSGETSSDDRMPAEQVLYRHIRTGGTYRFIGVGKMQCSGWFERVQEISSVRFNTCDMLSVVLYQSMQDGTYWVRPFDEFFARFERVRP